MWTTPDAWSCLSRCASTVRDISGAASSSSPKARVPKHSSRMMMGVQRSPNTSAVLATGQNWEYVIMAASFSARSCPTSTFFVLEDGHTSNRIGLLKPNGENHDAHLIQSRDGRMRPKQRSSGAGSLCVGRSEGGRGCRHIEMGGGTR